MEFLPSKNRDVRILKDGKIYTFTDMGWFLEPVNGIINENNHPSHWVLTKYEELNEQGRPILTITGLVDQNGNYLKISLKKGSHQRVLNLYWPLVLGDKVYIKSDNFQPSKTYDAFYEDEYKLESIDKYLNKTQNYEGENGNKILSYLLTNEKVASFLIANEELKQLVNQRQKTNQRRK